jgi:serine O-acetyltransferase
MASIKEASDPVDPIWQAIRDEAAEQARRESLIAYFLNRTILEQASFETGLAFLLANKLADSSLAAEPLEAMIAETFRENPEMALAAGADLQAVCARDPASTAYWIPFLYFKGFHALQSYRVSHSLWQSERRGLALHIQNRASELFAVDIHPAARLGSGIFIDHATGVVMGETCVVEDDVSLLHEVTLGGTGKQGGDRHPKVRRGVLICAGAKVLGNVEVGEGSKVAAGSVVLSDVPAHSTVAGVPAEVVGRPAADQPALEMNSRLGE